MDDCRRARRCLYSCKESNQTNQDDGDDHYGGATLSLEGDATRWPRSNATNAEIPFEGVGITVAQALGRMGGLRDERADVRGVFIFRLAKPEEVGDLVPAGSPTTPDGKIPVIYRLSLKEPNGFFIAQSFPIRDHDVVYVSNAPLADIQKFVNVVTSLSYSIVGIKNGF